MLQNVLRQVVRSVGSIGTRSFASSSFGTAKSATSPLTYLSEDEMVMKETVAKLAQEQIAPLVKKMDEEHQFDPSVVRALFDNGLMGIEVSDEYGGSACNFMTTMLVVEELSKVCPATAAFVDIHNTLVNSLMIKLGTAEQKSKYLPKLSQEYSGSFALSEPSAGSDAFSLKTTAKKDTPPLFYLAYSDSAFGVRSGVKHIRITHRVDLHSGHSSSLLKVGAVDYSRLSSSNGRDTHTYPPAM